jgi:Zn-finger nucleic acid-binding protein
MSYMHCPVCGLNLSRTAEMERGAEDCPRCLAQSSGTTSVKLLPGRTRESKPSRGRVTRFLRELRPIGARK